ncbi:MAG TPA: immunoglobulin domain-containing protein [Verrucomicrobiae bacterium]|nr:immunoglobulin domain-containing protein [Verrucomicrobiae bacterium]
MSVASSFTTLSNGTKAFDIDLPLQTSFFFDPSKGNLLVDLRDFTGCGASLHNNSVANIVDAVSRIYNTSNPNATSASGNDSGGGVIEIGYIPAPLSPTIAYQPTDQAATVGGMATFNVTAGPPPLSYQWFYHDIGQPIWDATNASLTLTNIQIGQAGFYFVQVTDIYGSTYSANALLTVATDPPVIAAQPMSQSGVAGTNFAFSVLVTGSLPLSYQWYFNTNTPINGATNASLGLTNIQRGQAGAYSVFVTNAYGWTNSAYAFLTVNFPPAPVLIVSTNVMGGNSVDVPVLLVANGNENTLTFSVNFNTQVLSYAGITLGSGGGDAALFPSTGQLPNGRLGVSLQLPDNETFAPGTQEVARVTFNSAVLTGSTPVITPVNFTNQPVNKLLFDAQNNELATNFISGAVTISPTAYEGDVAPRPAGNQGLDIFDWSQVGKFVAGVDLATNATEFQRADCAPKSTGGDGQLKVTDWVQAGRYVSAADAPTPMGGPAAPVAPTILTGGPRTVTTATSGAVQGTPLTLPVTLQSQGNENAIGFSLNFDPTVLKYSSTAKGSAAASATLDVNSNQVAAGILGVALALPAGNSFATGSQEVVRVNFMALTSTTNSSVTFSDAPVLRSLSDPLANELSANYSNAAVVVNPPPVLSISLANTNARLSWPNWATGFNLQASGVLPAPTWTNISGPAQTNSSNIFITVPALDPSGYFRLQHP